MSIHPTAIISGKATIGTNPNIGAYCVVGDDVVLGDNIHLHSHVVIEGDTHIGNNCEIYPFACIGSAPQDLKYAGEKTKTRIGNNNRIREYVTINAGTVQDKGITKIGDNCLLMISVHIAHDCVLGNGVILANNATLAGHVHVGDGAVIGGLAAVHQFVRIGHNAMIGGMSGIEQDIIPFGLAMGKRASLAGINIVGLKRADYSKDDIKTIITVYKDLFANKDGDFQSRLASVMESHKNNPAIAEIIKFVQADSSRKISTPE